MRCFVPFIDVVLALGLMTVALTWTAFTWPVAVLITAVIGWNAWRLWELRRMLR